MNIILNEVEEAKRRIQENELGDRYTETISLIARYYRQIDGLDEKETIGRIDGFMRQNCEMYNPIKWRGVIAKCVKEAKKYKMVQIENVGITQQELDIISSMDERRLRKLLFTLICLAKFYNKRSGTANDWVSTEYKDIFRMAHLFVDHENEPLWLIDDFRDLGNEYVFRTEGADLMKCESCGLVVKKKCNVHKYCTECYEKNHSNQKRTWKMNNRK